MSKTQVLSKFPILYWAAFITILSCMWPTSHKLDTPATLCFSCTWLQQWFMCSKQDRQAKTSVCLVGAYIITSNPARSLMVCVCSSKLREENPSPSHHKILGSNHPIFVPNQIEVFLGYQPYSQSPDMATEGTSWQASNQKGALLKIFLLAPNFPCLLLLPPLGCPDKARSCCKVYILTSKRFSASSLFLLVQLFVELPRGRTWKGLLITLFRAPEEKLNLSANSAQSCFLAKHRSRIALRALGLFRN